jgi:mannitol/fructose-specific phosphotransferase system IIA component (Ntr-type)
VRLSNFFSEDLVLCNVAGDNTEQVISNIIENISLKRPDLMDFETFRSEVLSREKLGSTGIGDEIAIPHARTDLVNQIVITFARTENVINFEAIDGLLVRYIYLIAVPTNELKTYLTTLAMISRLVKDEDIRHLMKNCKSGMEFLNGIKKFEEKIE